MTSHTITARPVAPRRFWYYERERIYTPLQEAIDARKRAAFAASDFERTYWRKEMRYQARNAVRECRKYFISAHC